MRVESPGASCGHLATMASEAAQDQQARAASHDELPIIPTSMNVKRWWNTRARLGRCFRKASGDEAHRGKLQAPLMSMGEAHWLALAAQPRARLPRIAISRVESHQQVQLCCAGHTAALSSPVEGALPRRPRTRLSVRALSKLFRDSIELVRARGRHRRHGALEALRSYLRREPQGQH